VQGRLAVLHDDVASTPAWSGGACCRGPDAHSDRWPQWRPAVL